MQPGRKRLYLVIRFIISHLPTASAAFWIVLGHLGAKRSARLPPRRFKAAEVRKFFISWHETTLPPSGHPNKDDSR
jgi:hypothetical protein